jgi:chromate transporter
MPSRPREPGRLGEPPRSRGLGRLGELARTFTWLGLTAFGGPAAHIAIMQRELVERRGWVTPERYLDLLGLSALLPGPSSTEVALGIGYERERWVGLLIAGLGFILPASLIVLVLAVLYEAAGGLATAGWLLYGMAPVVIAVIGHAMIRLAPTAFTDMAGWLIGLSGFAASLLGLLYSIELLSPIVVLLVSALAMLVVRRVPWPAGLPAAAALPAAAVLPVASTGGAAALGLGAIFAMFLKMGVVVFGSGYVLVAFLGSELVAPGYLTQQELLDAIAIGQLTPGPVFTSATFIGYLLAGIPGAIVATVAIFLPAFVLVGATHPFIDRIRANAALSAAIDGLNAAAVGLIGASVVFLARDAFMPEGSADLVTLLIGAAAFVLLLSGRLGPVPLLIAGALVGFLAQAVRA